MNSILSIDIGVKNLGICLLEFTDAPQPTVVLADVLNIDGGTIRQTIDNLLDVIKETLQKHKFVDAVLIEQQPLRHVKMMSIMYGLYGGMRILGKRTQIVSPRLRVSYLGLKSGVTYAQRKKASVIKVKGLFGEDLLKDKGKKLDDVADAILQGLAWKAVN